MKWLQKKSTEDLRTNKFLNRASNEVNGCKKSSLSEKTALCI